MVLILLIFGFANLDSVCAAGDKIAVLNIMSDGRQRLFIFNPPDPEDEMSGKVGDPITSDVSFGYAFVKDWRRIKRDHSKEVIAMAGVDIDGNGLDKIAVLNVMSDGRQRLFIFNPPDPADEMRGTTGPPIAADLTFGTAKANSDLRANAIAGIQY